MKQFFITQFEMILLLSELLHLYRWLYKVNLWTNPMYIFLSNTLFAH